MYQQDLARLIAQMHNNMSLVYFKADALEQADLANSYALIEDPDYAKAMLRLVQIKEAQGSYKSAIEMANFSLMRFDNPDEEMEDPENARVVPEFKEAIIKI